MGRRHLSGGAGVMADEQTRPVPTNHEPIAIVGIGCRLPGGADSPEALWRLLCEEFDAVGSIPPSRFDADALYDPRPATPGRIMSRRGGFVDGIEELDAAFFGIAPREAERLDPQQRLLLETAWEALEDAGVPLERISGTDAGTFVGLWLNEFEAKMFADLDGIDFHMTTGTGRYAASGRLAYFLDARGPSVTVDTACSSSLVAVHLACQSIWSGECDLALAGGANVILDPTITIAYSQSRMMAPDGRCKFGDASADGYVRSDGAAIVVLKPLARAHADGDHVYAVIRGTAVTNDGRSSGFLATPGQAGQEQMLRQAYRHAGVDPRTVQYVEAHGTGTPAGDPVELGALGAVLGVGRPEGAPCLVGSIKTNVGHTEGAAGIAGLVKVALALEHREIPASLHLRERNPSIPWDDLRVDVCASRRAWPVSDTPARAGVSAFGITGTNAHVVLEAAPPAPQSTLGADAAQVGAERATSLLLPISAAHPGALASLVERYLALLEGTTATDAAQLCRGAARSRTHHSHRVAFAASDVEELRDAMASWLRGEQNPRTHAGRAGGAPRVAFVFPGQGAQWHGMAREMLATNPVFRAAFERCDRAIAAEAGWSPIEELEADERHSRLGEIDVVQPLLFAIQVSLAASWRAWGVEPSAVVGHSMGEVAAAHVSGALDLDDAVAVICRRSRLLRTVTGQGAMAVVDLPVDETEAAIAQFRDLVSIAVVNSPRSTVISGDPSAIASVLGELERRDIFSRPVNVDVASHSPQMDPLLDDLRRALGRLRHRRPAVRMYSTVDVEPTEPPALDADYWARNLRQPVRFSDAIAQLAEGGHTVFIEMSPHPVLLPAIEQVLRIAGRDGEVVASLRRSEADRVSVAVGIGQLYALGVDVRWDAITPASGPRVALPTYPWQRERFWYEPAARASRSREAAGSPWLGRATRLADAPNTTVWENQLDPGDVEFLREHRVAGGAVMPAAGFVECAFTAGEADGNGPVAIEDLAFTELFAVGDESATQIALEGDPSGARRMRIFGASDGGPWRLHADGRLRPQRDVDARAVSVADVQQRCTMSRSPEAHLAAMQRRGLLYGDAFQAVGQSWVGSGEAIGRLTCPPAAVGGHATRIALLDGALQLALAALPETTASQTFLPVAAEHLARMGWTDDRPPTWAHAVVAAGDDGAYRGDVALLDADGAVLAEVRGLVLRRAGSSDDLAGVDELLYETAWVALDDEREHATSHVDGTWIVYLSASGVGADLARRLRACGATCVTVAMGESYRRLAPSEFEMAPGGDPSQHVRLLDDILGHARSCRGIVYAWAAGIEASDPHATALAEVLGVREPVALVQALDAVAWAEAPELHLITRNAQLVDVPRRDATPVPVAAHQAVMWGLGRVIATERPERRCTLIDLDPAADTADERALLEVVHHHGVERQIALRDGRVHLARVRRRVPDAPASGRTRTIDTAVYGIGAASPGTLDSVGPRATTRRAPGPGEVEVRVDAAALNFLDVLKALGVYPDVVSTPDTALGAECAGTVVAVGAGVEEVAVGDAVVAITPSYDHVSLFRSFATVPARFVAPRPPHISAVAATTLPVAVLTAYYSLHELARVRPGERVLIHSATGGVGLAALQICRRAGAEVYATAGSPDKRAFLATLGIEHVYDSRTTDFADAILADTGGRGVDIVLNSLAGDAIAAGLRALGPRGRFVEIGKRDVYEDSRIGLGAFKKNLALFVVDLARMTVEDPTYVSALFREVMALVASGELEPLVHTTFPVTAAADAFRTMAQAGHIGKLVLTFSDQELTAATDLVRADATYLVTGGLGDIGLAVAQWLADRGARHLVLLGRSEAQGRALDVVAGLAAAGVQVVTARADVSNRDELAAALEVAMREAPPLRGVVHAAGVLADATLAELDESQIAAALAPKVAGGWNLHLVTRDQPLDFFVMFSSVAALLGLPGQGNYAAGNAFLDALAHRRRAERLPASSIAWGPWTEIGLAAADANRGSRLERLGLGGIAPREALVALNVVLTDDDAYAAVMRFDAARWRDSEPTTGPLLSLLTAGEGPAAAPMTGGLLDTLRTAPSMRHRLTMLEDAICAEVAPVLRLAATRIDRSEPLKGMGLDSLMALELRNRLEARTGLTLSATTTWNYPTVTALAAHLADRLGLAPDEDDQPITHEVHGGLDAGPVASDADVAADMSADELEALLDEELAAIDKLLGAE